MNAPLIAHLRAEPCGFDRVDVADDVGDRRVRCGELLDVAGVFGEPSDRRRVALFCDDLLTYSTDRVEGVVVELAVRNNRNFVV